MIYRRTRSGGQKGFVFADGANTRLRLISKPESRFKFFEGVERFLIRIKGIST